MKILLDHNLDWRLKRHLPGHDVTSADELGWHTLKNGVLLQQAEAAGFEILLSGDGNIYYQQNLAGRAISIVVLRALNNRRQTHLPMMPEVLAVLTTIGSGQLIEVWHESWQKKPPRT